VCLHAIFLAESAAAAVAVAGGEGSVRLAGGTRRCSLSAQDGRVCGAHLEHCEAKVAQDTSTARMPQTRADSAPAGRGNLTAAEPSRAEGYPFPCTPNNAMFVTHSRLRRSKYWYVCMYGGRSSGVRASGPMPLHPLVEQELRTNYRRMQR